MRTWLLFLTLVCPMPRPVSASEAAELDLLVPVDTALAQKIREYNGNEVERQIFFTRRWRIVEVRPEVLCRSEVVRFAAFPDADFILNLTATTDPSGSPRPGSWRGTITSPMLPEDERDRREQALAWVLGNVPQLQFQGAEGPARAGMLGTTGHFYLEYWAVDPSTGIAEQIEPHPLPDPCAAFRDLGTKQALEPHPALGMTPEQVLGWASSGVFTVSARVSLPTIGSDNLNERTRFVLQPLACSPRYHIVYEYDNFRGGWINASGPNAELVQQQWHDFLAGLPADADCVPIGGFE